MSELYFSTDVETDGPIPGKYSMLSLGCAVFDEAGHMLDTFYANLELLDGAVADPETMRFWKSQREVWAKTREYTRPPKVVMTDFVEWVVGLREEYDASPVFVAYPAGFDFTFVYWYIVAHGLKSPFSFSALDMKSYAAAKLRKPYRDATKRSWPKEWKRVGVPHTHYALDDAIEQGEQFVRMLRA